MAFNFFKKLIQPQSILGVDIGTTSIKIAEIAKDGKEKPRLLNYGLLETSSYLERFNMAIQASTLNLFDKEVINYLKIILQKANFKSDQAIASLPSFAVFTTLIEIPDIPAEETVKAMNFQVKQYLPMPLASVMIDWIRVGERTDDDGNKKQQIFLIAVPLNQIESYKRIFSAINLRLVAVEIEGMSLARALTTDLRESTLIVDIGSRSTALLIAKDGLLKFSSQIDFAGASLTQSLATGLNIAVSRAEAIKKQKGLSGLVIGAERDLSTQILTILDVIINETKRVKDNYESNYRHTVKSVILSGGGANLLGIENYFSKEIGLPVVKADTLSRLDYPESLELIRKDIGPSMAVAIGLAMRGL